VTQTQAQNFKLITTSDGRLHLARWATVASAAALSVSIALFQVLMALGVLLWLSAERWKTVPARLQNQRLITIAGLLWLWILASSLWSQNTALALDEAWKYRKLLWILPVALLIDNAHEKTPGRSQVFSSPSGGLTRSDRSGGALWQRRTFWALLSGWFLCLLGSLCGRLADQLGFAWPHPLYQPHHGTLGLNYIQLGITQVGLALGACAWVRQRLQMDVWSYLALLIAAAALWDVLFNWEGRLALISFVALSIWLAWHWRPGVKKLTLAVAAVALIGTAAYTQSSGWTQRSPQAQLQQHAQAHTANSTALRLSYWRCALAIWRQHPLIGVGAGSRPLVQDPNCSFENPTFAEYARRSTVHQQYLQFMAETGAIGLALFIALIVSSLISAQRQAHTPEGELVFALLLLLPLGALFNSFMRDAIEGHLWALVLGLASTRLRA
jgi:O-antigen ligase